MKSGKRQRKPEKSVDNRLIPTFLQKTYELVNNKEFKDIVTWGSEPGTFIIYDIMRFRKEVLPKYFKQNKLPSFIRQLNMYDFHKQSTRDSNGTENGHMFSNPYFLKGNEQSLLKINRKKNEKQGRTQASNSFGNAKDENKDTYDRFMEDYSKTKKYLQKLENCMKELVSNYSHLIDECKQLSLQLNDLTKDLQQKLQAIYIMLINSRGGGSYGGSTTGKPFNNLRRDWHADSGQEMEEKMIPYAEQVPNYKFVEQLGGPKATNSYINSIMSFLLNNQRSDKKKQQYHTIALPALHELTMGGPGEPNQSEKQPSPLDFNLSRASLASQGNSPRLVSPRYPGEEPPFPRQEVGAELGKRAKPGFDSESLLLSRQAANPKKLVLDGYSFEGSEFNGDAGLNANSVPPSPDASFRAFDLFQDQPESPSRLSRDEEFTPKEPLDLS